MGTLAMVLVSIALTASSIGWQEAVTNYGNKVSHKVIKLAQQLYTKIQNNNELLERLTDAYNSRNSGLMTELLQGAGFGSRNQAIKEAMETLRSDYNNEKSRIVKENTDLTNKYNEANNVAYSTGTIAGAKYAEDVYNNINQAINGGLTNEKK